MQPHAIFPTARTAVPHGKTAQTTVRHVVAGPSLTERRTTPPDSSGEEEKQFGNSSPADAGNTSHNALWMSRFHQRGPPSTGVCGMQPTERHMSNARKWFIMTSPDPRLVEVRLLEENIRRERGGLSTFQYFIPYQFLKHRVADPNPDDMSGDGPYNPLNRADVSANNQLRSALRRYIFIRSSDRELERFLEENSGRESCRTLWYYRDRDRNRLTVSDSAMGSFIDACCDRRIRFEVWPCVDHIGEGAEVVLNSTPFKGCRGRVLEVRQDRRGTTLTVGIRVLQGVFFLRLPSVRMEDVLYEPKDASPVVRENNRYKLVEDTQRQIFGVMSRRLGGVQTGKSRARDLSLLESLYNYRYRVFEGDAMRRKFKALMLLCALLLGDRDGTSDLVKDVRRELDEVDSRPRSKVSVSVRAFLLSALYLATKEPQYYKEAVEYFRVQEKLPEVQKQLVGFVEKWHGEKS